MEVQLRPELEEKLNELSSLTGRPAGELVEDVIEGYFDELAEVRETLDSRYDDIKSGKVKLIPGEEVFAKLRRRENQLLKPPNQRA